MLDPVARPAARGLSKGRLVALSVVLLMGMLVLNGTVMHKSQTIAGAA